MWRYVSRLPRVWSLPSLHNIDTLVTQGSAGALWGEGTFCDLVSSYSIANSDIVFREHRNRTRYHARTSRHSAAGSFHLLQVAFPDFAPKSQPYRFRTYTAAALVWQRVRRFTKSLERATWDNLQGVVKRRCAMPWIGQCHDDGWKLGEILHGAIRGVDQRELESDKPRMSVSGDINVRIERPSHLDRQAAGTNPYTVRHTVREG
jgi:hypothetical protein